MSASAYEMTEQQAEGVQTCIRAVVELTCEDGILSNKEIDALIDLAKPLVWEGMSPKYIIARMMLKCGHPGLWEQVREEPT